MNAENNNEQSAAASAIDIWENEGGALRQFDRNFHYGRRVEADRSWTVYHVFTGVPAEIGGNTMIGLSRTAATNRMLWLNGRNEARRGDGGCLVARIPLALYLTEGCRR